MRHFLSADPVAPPTAVAALALGMTVSAASRVLIPASRRAHRFAPSEVTATRPTVLLAPITARADEHLAPAPGTQKHPGIVHRSPRRGGLDDPQSPGNTALGAVRKCGSGRSLGRDRHVNSVRGCAGLPGPCDLTPTPPRRHRTGARRRPLPIGHIDSGGKHVLGGVAGTIQCVLGRPSQITSRPDLHHLCALLGSHEHSRTLLDNLECRRLVHAMAKAVIEDAQDRDRPISLMLESLAVFVIQRATLRRHLESTDIEKLIEQAYLRAVLHDSGSDVLVVRTPELLASEAAYVLSLELAEHAKEDTGSAAEWLSGAAEGLPLGDVVAAYAVIDAAIGSGGLPLNLIRELINTPPQQHSIMPGSRMAMHWPGAGTMDLTFREGGEIDIRAQSGRMTVKSETDEEEQVTVSDFHSWLILSHLAGLPFAVESRDGRSGRADPAILLEVGASPFVLRRPDGEGVPPKLIIFNGFLVGAGAQHCQGQIRQRDRFATTMTIPTRNGDFGVTRAGSEWPARRAHSTACPNA